MQPRTEDRLSAAQGPRRPQVVLIVAAVLVVAVLGFFFLQPNNSDLPEVAAPVAPPMPRYVPPAEPQLAPAPDIPRVTPELMRAKAQDPDPVPVMPTVTLETSDTVIRETLGPAADSALLATVLLEDNLVERGAGLVDGFSRGLVPRKILPLKPPASPFRAVTVEGQAYLDPASFERYDSYASAIAGLDTARLVAGFHRFRPLLEQAYAALGHAPEDLDNALIRSLDQVLATPQVDGPIAVNRVEAIYKYRDPALEGLVPLQKQLLRMGPGNTQAIKKQAAALREGLLE